jgi:AcrR family transcriptional regulator
MAVTTMPDTRECILDATDALMQRFGFRKMTMDDVAREAGVSRRTIYTYFPSKEELGLSSIARVVALAQRRMADASNADGTHAERLRKMLVGRVMARVESVRDYRQSLDELFEAVRPAYMERRKRNFETETRLIRDLIQDGVTAREFDVKDPALAAEMLLKATNAYLPYSLSVADLGDTDAIRKEVSAMAELLIRGLRRFPEGKLS